MKTPVLAFSLLLTSGLVAQQPPAPKDPGTWILQLEGDSASLRLTGATHKPFPFRARRHLASRFRLHLLDAGGKRLSSMPIDLSDFCLNPAHRGKKDHVRGDVIVQHRVVTTIKVPALPALHEIRIIQMRGERTTLLGKIDRKSILTFAHKPKEVR